MIVKWGGGGGGGETCYTILSHKHGIVDCSEYKQMQLSLYCNMLKKITTGNFIYI